MNFMQIRYFLLVAKYLNFTKSAEHAFTTQSNISKQISSLEDLLGVKLFVRSTKQVSLTPKGSYLADEFEQIIKKFDDALINVKDKRYGTEGYLHIGLNGQLDIDHITPNLFIKFKSLYPKIELKISSLNFKGLRDGLLDKDLDIILTYSFEQQHNKNTSRLLMSRSNPRIYYLKENFIENPTYKDFKNKSLIRLQNDQSQEARNFIKNVCEKNNIVFNGTIDVNSLETMKFYLESGMGVAVLGSSYQLTNSNKLSFIEIDDPSSSVGTDALWLKSNLNPSMPLFLNLLKRYVDNHDQK